MENILVNFCCSRGPRGTSGLTSIPIAGGAEFASRSHHVVSWWTKQRLGRFFSGFLPFSSATNFIPPFVHTHLIHFISSVPVMVHQASSAGTDLQYSCFITSHPSIRPSVGHELRRFLVSVIFFSVLKKELEISLITRVGMFVQVL